MTRGIFRYLFFILVFVFFAGCGPTTTGVVKDDVTLTEESEQFDAMGVYYAGAGYPRVLFMIAEQNIGEVTHRFSWWYGDEFKGETFEMSVVENYLKEAFTERNFNVVDISGSTGNVEVSNIMKVSDLTLERVRRIGGDLNAEVVIKGKAIVRPGPAIEGSEIGLYLADVTVEAIRLDTGTILTAAFAHGSARHISRITGGAEALRAASAELADSLIDRLLVRWSGPLKIRVTIGGPIDMLKAAEFAEAIEARVPSVSAVYQRGFEDGEALFELESAESAATLAAELAKLEGWSIKVFKTGPESIELLITESPN